MNRRGSVLPALAIALMAAAPDRRLLQQSEAERSAELTLQQQAEARQRAAAAQAQALGAERVAAAARLREAEAATDAAARRLSDLDAQMHDAQARLDKRAGDIEPLLPLIERLALYPAETLLAVPESPTDALRGLLVLRGMAQTLESEAESLREEQRKVAALQTAIAEESPRLATAERAQAEQASRLDAAIAAARDTEAAAEDAATGAARAASAAAAKADSLRGAIAAIEADRRAAEAQARDQAASALRDRHTAEAAAARVRQVALARPAGPGLAATGQLTPPVAGTLVKAWGDPADGGPATGLSYAVPPGARVVSPCGGKVVFAAPFRSYGLLLIVDCGGGYHFVLAGLNRLDAQVGRPVQAGEPVGVMADWDPRAAKPHPLLYVELRHDGQAVNPAPFLRAKG